MFLAIDIGNTNTVFAVFDGEKVIKDGRFETVASRSADEYAALIEAEQAHDAIISSVVPDANKAITKFCQDTLKFEPVFVSQDIVDLVIDLDKPDEVGADRIVNAIAVLAHYQSPAIVVDFGTATTFDVIDTEGRYAGGAIAPGINLSLAALHEAAAKLPDIPVKEPKNVIGKDTVQAMQSGIYWGYIGLIEGMVNKISNELDVKPFVLATGGLAPLFAGNTHAIDTVDQDLTLKGLLQIYLQHKARKT